MGIEETIQFLADSAAAQEAKLAKLEQNSAALEQALRHLTERQRLLELWAASVQAVLEDMEERPFYRRRKSRPPSSAKRESFIAYRNCRPALRPPRKRT